MRNFQQVQERIFKKSEIDFEIKVKWKKQVLKDQQLGCSF